MRKPHDDDCLTETNVRKPSLKELAQQVIERHAAHEVAADLEGRIRAMARRWDYSPEELTQELAFAADNPDKALAWVEQDEANCLSGAE